MQRESEGDRSALPGSPFPTPKTRRPRSNAGPFYISGIGLARAIRQSEHSPRPCRLETDHKLRSDAVSAETETS
jgi:hypothetical protein